MRERETDLEIVRAVIDAGMPLTSVEYCMDVDLPAAPVAIRWTFESRSFVVAANGFDDTVVVSEQVPGEYAELRFSEVDRAASPWHDALGAKLKWAWLLTNHQGYSDGVQLQFEGLDDGPARCCQLLAMASTLQIRVVAERAAPAFGRSSDLVPHRERVGSSGQEAASVGSPYHFRTDTRARQFCDEIAAEIVRRFGFSTEEAIGRINRHWARDFDLVEDRDDIRYHEDVDYWSRAIVYGKDSEWWLDPPGLKPKPYP